MLQYSIHNSVKFEQKYFSMLYLFVHPSTHRDKESAMIMQNTIKTIFLYFQTVYTNFDLLQNVSSKSLSVPSVERYDRRHILPTSEGKMAHTALNDWSI